MFVDVFDTVTTTLTTFEAQAVSNLATYLTTFARTAAIIVVMLLGLSYLQWVPINIAALKLVKTLAIIAVVFLFALSVDNYNAYIGNHLMQLPDDLLQAIMPAGSGDTMTIGRYLDETVTNLGDGIGKIWKTGTFRNAYGPSLLACVLFLLLCLLGAAAMVTILFAKIGISLVVAIGPLFVLALISPHTREFFTKWLSYALQMAILQVLIGGVILIARSVLDVYILQLTEPAGTIANSPGAVIAPAIVMLVIAAMFAQLPNIASSLAGGIGLSSGVTPGGIAGAAMRGLSKLFQKDKDKNSGGAPASAGAAAGGGSVSEGSGGQAQNAIMRAQRTQAQGDKSPPKDAPQAPAQRSSASAAAFAKMQADMKKQHNDNNNGDKK